MSVQETEPYPRILALSLATTTQRIINWLEAARLLSIAT
jgi:hypothetical protein